MNFKKNSFAITAMITMTIGTVGVETRAQAASLAPGSFLLFGESSITDNNNPFNTADGFVLNFNNMNIASGVSQGVFSGLDGTPTVNSLFLDSTGLTPNGLPGYSAVVNGASTPTFISGVTLADNTEITVELFSGSFEGTVFNQTNYNLSGTFNGLVKDVNGQVIANGSFFGMFNPANMSLSTVGVQTFATPAPTPVMLPGLIGMGVAALRKKKKQK